jgi:hypothetical protein
MSTEIQVAVDCADPYGLALFWADVLHYRVEHAPAGHDDWAAYSKAVGAPGEAWNAIVDPDGGGPRLLFHRVPEPKTTKNRWHLDVRAGGPRGTPVATRRPLVDAEADRLAGLGASVVAPVDDGEDYFVVMRDPEGNEFCVC